MFRRLSSVMVVAGLPLVLGLATGCKKDEVAKPEPTPTSTAAATGRQMPKHPGRGANQFNRPDPQVTKDYRVDICYYGTFSLRQARDAYLASLGKDEPSAKKLPSFGTPGAPPGTPAAQPGATATPKTLPTAAPSGSAAATPPVPDRSREILARVPHERNARSCTSTVGLKDAPMGEVDTQMAGYAPFAEGLAKDLTVAQQYYLREEYTKDNFAKGKELDKKLRESFAKLDEMSDKLGAALDAWRQAHAPDASKMEEGEKLARAVMDDARAVLLAVAHKKADGEAWKQAVDKLDKSAAAMKAYSDGHASDNWAKIMGFPVENLVKTVKGAKVTPDHSIDSDSYLSLVTGFTALIDARQRAISRAARPMPGAAPGGPPGTPPGAPPAPPPASAEPPKAP